MKVVPAAHARAVRTARSPSHLASPNEPVGSSVGADVGVNVGADVGAEEGSAVGNGVGSGVTQLVALKSHGPEPESQIPATIQSTVK